MSPVNHPTSVEISQTIVPKRGNLQTISRYPGEDGEETDDIVHKLGMVSSWIKPRLDEEVAHLANGIASVLRDPVFAGYDGDVVLWMVDDTFANPLDCRGRHRRGVKVSVYVDPTGLERSRSHKQCGLRRTPRKVGVR